MAKKKKKKSSQKHPTLFAYQGALRYYPDGSMLELYTQLSEVEWTEIVQETIKYRTFLECLKEFAFPKLKEKWTEDDEYFKLMLEVAISRIRNIDPILVAKYDQKELKERYLETMKSGVENINAMVKDIKQIQNDTLKIISSNI